MNIDYKTKPQPELTRTLRKAVNVDLMLPLAVNVQDFFRPDWYVALSNLHKRFWLDDADEC